MIVKNQPRKLYKTQDVDHFRYYRSIYLEGLNKQGIKGRHLTQWQVC